ncbi:MAG TPA: 50S ribosomal protein L13 [Candidatus Dojkabacteria bacterium]|nr:50S ribosomal protein L13 [Candidatus Dojkabacteria bacterium]
MKYKTTWTKKEDVKRNWYIVDVKDQILGRAATKIASLLIGKEKVNSVPNLDNGDYVIVINSDFIKLTRGKEETKVYHTHSTYPGGHKETSFRKMLKENSPKIIENAVLNMLPNNKLRDTRMPRLYVYPQAEHKNGGQKPIEIKL